MNLSMLLPMCAIWLGAPAPFTPPSSEANGLKLEIKASGRLDYDNPKYLNAGDGSVEFRLTNLRKEKRTLAGLSVRGNRIDFSNDVTLVLWFPDGTVLERNLCWRNTDLPIANEAAAPLELASGGCSRGEHYAIPGMDDREFMAFFKKNKGQFCLAAVIGDLGIQSNTVPFNSCPFPPKTHVPVKLSRNDPDVACKRRLAEAKQREVDHALWLLDHLKLKQQEEAERRAGKTKLRKPKVIE